METTTITVAMAVAPVSQVDTTTTRIERRVKSHALRHSLTIPLLKTGTDLRTIQEVLGHEDITTTEIHLHAATGVHGLGVVSPLDGLAP